MPMSDSNVDASSMANVSVDTLSAYLSAHVVGFKRLKSVQKFADGQSNPTYRLSAESGNYVLRRKPDGELLKSAHAVDREYRVMTALADTDVPVPATYHLCEDVSVVGSEFFIMSCLPGRTFWNPALPELTGDQRKRCYDQLNATLAAIHCVDINKVGLNDFGKPGNYYARQTSRWTQQYQATETEDIPAMNAVINWLEHNMLEDDGRISLVHGDFRIDNVMFNADATQILGVLDWELSTLGHPYADLAYQCALWRLPPDAALAGLKGVDRVAAQLPNESDYVERYCERTGVTSLNNWNFYLVFSLFRMAAIVQGVKKRALDGNASASNEQALRVGALAKPLANEAAALL